MVRGCTRAYFKNMNDMKSEKGTFILERFFEDRTHYVSDGLCIFSNL